MCTSCNTRFTQVYKINFRCYFTMFFCGKNDPFFVVFFVKFFVEKISPLETWDRKKRRFFQWNSSITLFFGHFFGHFFIIFLKFFFAKIFRVSEISGKSGPGPRTPKTAQTVLLLTFSEIFKISGKNIRKIFRKILSLKKICCT